MKDFSTRSSWMNYIETPLRTGNPVKLDKILAQRMEAFMRARQTKLAACTEFGDKTLDV